MRALKGPTRPINSAEDRAEVLAALACVDYVTVFADPRATRLLAQVRPHVYVKGGDYRLETLNPEEYAVLQAAGARDRIRADGAGAFDHAHHRTDAGRRTDSLIYSMTPPLVLGVLGSGKGSNYAAIAQAIETGALNAKVALVASDVPDAGILHLAARHGTPAIVANANRTLQKQAGTRT